MSLLDEHQKITAKGRGIFSFTSDSQPAYVPLSNLRSSQTQAISLVNSYDPETEFLASNFSLVSHLLDSQTIIKWHP
ncbi:MAG: hypothetical protein QNJ72_18315 [Pleurocapsa sp. MO_226.B13]|nr:hypothetical protein [Pleurocapsa sp. MO_226.B13]